MTRKTRKRQPYMILNGEPVYASPPAGPTDEAGLEALAFRITNNRNVAAAWMDRPNPRLRNRTPRQAARDGDGQQAADILWSFLAL